VKPDFTWKNCLFWIKETNGVPRFEMEEAFGYRRANEPLQWVLVNVLTRPPHIAESAWVNDTYPHQTVTLKRGNPASDEFQTTSWAEMIGSSRQKGSVYELGWVSQENNGNGHYIEVRHIYFLRDAQSLWHLLGVAELFGSGYIGSGRNESSKVTVHVQWLESAPFGVQVFLTQEASKVILSEDFEKSLHGGLRPEFTQYSEYWLSPGVAEPKPSGTRPYTITQKGDSGPKLLAHIAFWTGKEEWTLERKKRWAEQLKVALQRINPVLKQKSLPVGTKIFLLDNEEIQKVRAEEIH
jgi:hypothetical protein